MQIDEVRDARGNTGAAVFRWGRPDWEKPEYDFQHPPYFYQPRNYPIPKGIRGWEPTDRLGADGAGLNKIVCYQSDQVPKLRPERHYDANIPYFNRYWIDKIREVDDASPVKFYIDIEAASDGRPLTNRLIEDAPNPIIIIGTYNTRTNETVLFANHERYNNVMIRVGKATIHMRKTEVEMANAFLSYWRFIRPDLAIAYNLDRYDWRYMPNRFRKIGVNVNAFSPILQSSDGDYGFKPKGVATHDLLKGYSYLKRKTLESQTLDAVCRKELGRGKTEDVDGRYMARAWAKDPMKIINYNIEDVDLMVSLDSLPTLKISDTFVAFHRVYGLNMADCEHASNMTEKYIMRRTPLIYPSYRLPIAAFKGADPDVPEVGLHHDLLCLDFSGAYSAAMECGNMDPSTLLTQAEPDCIDIDGVYFKQHSRQVGHYVNIIRELNKMKSHWGKVKKSCVPMSPEFEQAELIRYAYKVGLLTIYGMTGQKSSRFYNPAIARSVTFFLRGAIKFATHEAKRAGYERIYGHTDSVFVRGHGNDLNRLIEQGSELRDLINKKIPTYCAQYNIKPEEVKLEIEFEKIARTGFFSKKTRYGLDTWWYAGKLVDPKDAIEIKGFDSLRGDTPPYAKPLQKQLIADILHNRPRKEIDQEIRQKLQPVREGKIDIYQLAVPNEMQKDLDRYPKGHPHAVGALFSNKYLGTGFERGSKARLLPVKTNGMAPASTPYICIDENTRELPNWVKVDWDRCYDKVLAKIGLVYESAGWDIRSISGQKKLFEFGLSEI